MGRPVKVQKQKAQNRQNKLNKTKKTRALILAAAAVISLTASLLAVGCAKTKSAVPSTKTDSSQTANAQTAAATSTRYLPKRIVVLSPSAAEILCEIGAYSQIAARTDFCDWPEQMQQKPSVGGFSEKSLSIEKIISYSPDMVYGSEGMHDFAKPQLESAGIKVYLSKAESVSSIIQEIIYMGELTGHTKKANELAQSIQNAFTAAQNKTQAQQSLSKQKNVYYEVWNSPYMSAGKSSYITEIIQAAGGTNIFSSLQSQYPLVSEEAIIAANPDVIILPDSNGISPSQVEQRPGWNTISAVKNKKIYTINADIISRPGPRITLALKQVEQILCDNSIPAPQTSAPTQTASPQ